jgi:predicted MFS family arabinose efflux permease
MTDWEGVITVWGWERIFYLIIGVGLAILVGILWSLYSQTKKKLRSILESPKEKLHKTNDFTNDNEHDNC